MEKLLENYIVDFSNYYQGVSIKNYSIEGNMCTVTYYTDIYQNNKEEMIINIWDVLVFLNNKIDE